MRVKYGNNVYEFKGDLNCLLFSSLLEEGIEEVELFMYEDIFKLLHANNLQFKKIKKYVVLYQALTYFGSNKDKELIKYLYDKMYKKEYLLFQKEIEDFFESEIIGSNMMHWDVIAENKSLSEDFFKKYLDVMGDMAKRELCGHVSLHFIGKYLTINWYKIGKNPNIPLSFFEKNLYRLSWDTLCENTSIPEEFFEKHIDKVDWKSLSLNESISEQFFRKHIDKIDKRRFARNRKQFNLQKEFLIYDKLMLEHCPYEYILENMDKAKENMDFVCMNPNVPLSFFEELSCDVLENCNTLSANPSIPVEFYEKNMKYIDWEHMSSNPNIPFSFLKRYSFLLSHHICNNELNLDERTLEKIKNTNYFNYEPLDKQIKEYKK